MEQKPEENIINLLISFANKHLKKKDIINENSRMIKDMFSSIILVLINNIDKYSLANCINNYILNELKSIRFEAIQDLSKKKKKKNSENSEIYKRINIFIIFLECIFTKFDDINFLSIDISWIYKLISYKEDFNYSSFLNILKTILLFIEKEENKDIVSLDKNTNNTQFGKKKKKLCVVYILLNRIKTEIENHVKEIKENYIFYKNKIKQLGVIHKNSGNLYDPLCKNQNYNEKEKTLENQNHINIINNISLCFKDTCDLFINIIEDKTEIDQCSIEWENEIKEIGKELMLLTPFINDKDIRNYLINTFFFTIKRYIFNKKEYEELCLIVIKVMYLFIRNDVKSEINSNYNFNEKKELFINNCDGIENKSYDEKYILYIYKEINSNFCTFNNNDVVLNGLVTNLKKDEPVDKNYLNSIYNFLVINIDDLYNIEFVKYAFIDDVRYYLLLYSESYKDEWILKKIIYIFNKIINIYKDTSMDNFRDCSTFLEAWERYECILKCIENFSIHLLKTNWQKVIDLINMGNQIRKKYELFCDSSFKEKKNIKKIKNPKNCENEQNEKYYDYNKNKNMGINILSYNLKNFQKNNFLFYDSHDYNVFNFCVKKKRENKQFTCTTFGNYSDYIILVLIEYLIWKLLIHDNNTVTRFSLCALIEQKENYTKTDNTQNMDYSDENVDKKSEEIGGIEISILLNSINDIFFFNIFFPECVKPTLFIKGDIPFYEFRIKNLIVSKILNRKNSIEYIQNFIISLNKINLFYANARIILEAIIQAIKIIENSKSYNFFLKYFDKKINGINECIDTENEDIELNNVMSKIILNIIHKIKNVSISRRKDLQIFVLKIVIKMNESLNLFSTIKSYSSFLQIFEEDFFFHALEYFEILTNKKINFVNTLDSNFTNLPEQVRLYVWLENNANIFLNNFIEKFNKVIDLNQYMYFYGYLRLFYLLLHITIKRNKKMNEDYKNIILRIQKDDNFYLVYHLVLYFFKNNLSHIFLKNDIKQFLVKNIGNLRNFIKGNVYEKKKESLFPCQNEKLNEHILNNSERSEIIATFSEHCFDYKMLRKLFIFTDIVEYCGDITAYFLNNKINYYNTSYSYKEKNMDTSGLEKSLIIRDNAPEETDIDVCRDSKNLYIECVNFLKNFTQTNIKNKDDENYNNLRVILALAYVSNTCTIFGKIEDEENLNKQILLMQMKNIYNDSSNMPKDAHIPVGNNNIINSLCGYGNYFCKNFNFYRYKYLYKYFSAHNTFKEYIFDNKIIFSETIVNDIEVSKEELVYVYFIIKLYIIPCTFSCKIKNKKNYIDNSIIQFRIKILNLLIKQSKMLIDRFSEYKFPTHLLELAFLTLFHPLIVKFEIELYSNENYKAIEDMKEYGYISFKLLNFVKNILKIGQNKLSICRSVVIPFLTSYFFSIIEYGNIIINISNEYLDKFVEIIVDILMHKECVLYDCQKSFTNDLFKIKKGNLNFNNFINENICSYFLNKIENNQHIIFPSKFFEIYHTSIFLRLLTLIFLINLFKILENKYICVMKIGIHNKTEHISNDEMLDSPKEKKLKEKKEEFYKKRNIILCIYEKLIIHILKRVDNKNVLRENLKNKCNDNESKQKNNKKDGQNITPLPFSYGHNIQIRGLQALCILSRYFKYIKKGKRKNIIFYVNTLLQYDNLSTTRQYLELFCSSICNSSFILLYPHLIKNILRNNGENAQLTISSLIISAHIFLKSKFSYYSFVKLNYNSFSGLTVDQQKYATNIFVKKQKNVKASQKLKGKKIKNIIRQILEKNKGETTEIAKDVDKTIANIKKKKIQYGKQWKLNEKDNDKQIGKNRKKWDNYQKEQNKLHEYENKEGSNFQRNKNVISIKDDNIEKEKKDKVYEMENKIWDTENITSKDNPQNGYFYSPYISKILTKLLLKIVLLCSSHSALIRSISQYILYNFLKKRKEMLLIPFLSKIYLFIKNNKDCKRIRDKLKKEFKNWDTSIIEQKNNICMLLPTYNHSFNFFDEDINCENTNTFTHILYNNELVSSYTFIDSIKKIVQQEMTSIMYNIQLEKEKKDGISIYKYNNEQKLLTLNQFYHGKNVDEISSTIDDKRDTKILASENGQEKKKKTTSQIINGEACFNKSSENIDYDKNFENFLKQTKKNYQKKFDPIDNIIEINNEFRKKYQLRKKNNLIVIASLIDKVPNLAGLCRTCEIFNVKKLLLSNINIVKDFQFQKISSTANKWMNIQELKKKDIIKYLIKKKKKYSIIGLEQTNDSKRLNDFIFPENCILILGDEKEGLPSSILLLLHHCVEIPGHGIIRSLNVHVSAAITIYEYFKQHL
ncbi:rRNA (adenosine-2'-O-)-methyltransferase, putative [Plasmodium berghei]|uniref:rRNA (Adenosine-2'-O-)-methyltransferase, putative n=2 Tax=Plasmodium berghei TaxID=5821 RepID=A0A509AKS3_PLABA|nr:rRNA (adenosine-2'-O-)-methyltransferase, putative [Plasmodium berghei ANKA]CXI51523.1 rRNA (adenosine-2'-O-)-methyltransferase, putative [Plasmodium berghei]SCL94454.1 rRNA (adenosine-2'-O-)-methyltransferase, putative [Plasmodium berghei]SCM16027.1 rRNA (adenosine-2'-O-)-methyltransferase, putative [Plasmodium berghei]SCN26088.1 rRNA (adenosine-2'-O-)-methyltransferase, putative [Plasmodium berghei]VUC56150.1 rRNA (adenosine-2'-O-)-methyltransferase, putative [Plasmodium berghei ANKA]|eukprot:XP_034421952.1 rRNA (adenosine-2'-O-)-methyltransferase, putative [Plasmodium berghei ANKA]